MKRLMIALLGLAAVFSEVSAAEAQRWHGDRGHGYHRGYGYRGYYGHGPRWGHRPYHRRGYWYYRHGHRYHGWR